MALSDPPAFPLIIPSRPHTIRMLVETQLAPLKLKSQDAPTEHTEADRLAVESQAARIRPGSVRAENRGLTKIHHSYTIHI